MGGDVIMSMSIQIFSKQLSISQILLNLQTSYLEQIHNNIRSYNVHLMIKIVTVG